MSNKTDYMARDITSHDAPKMIKDGVSLEKGYKVIVVGVPREPLGPNANEASIINKERHSR